MATLLEAERRWILTGTPTRSFSSEVTTTALRHLYQVTLPSPLPPSSLQWLLRCCGSFATSLSLLLTAKPSGRDSSLAPWSTISPAAWLPRIPEPILCSRSCLRSGSRAALCHLISASALPDPQVMIRHSKEGMANIPKPKWKKTLLEMNATEKTSYNAIVALAQSNLVTTGPSLPPRSPFPESAQGTTTCCPGAGIWTLC
jgi:hypothetical protein